DSLSDSSLGYSSDTSSGHSIPYSSFDTPAASFAGPSRKRHRSPTVSVPLDDSTEESYEAYIDPDIDLDVQADIDANTMIFEAVAARKADARVEVDTRIDSEDEDEEEAESSHRGTIKIGVDTVVEPVVSEDTHVPTDDEDSREVIESVQRDQGHRMLAASQQSAVMSDRIRVLERDNMRLRAMLCIERERIDSLRHHMAYTQEELRQMRRFCYYDRMEFRRLETYARRR
ncbi:hypothetical protein Tco_0042074, partial [Tanacetum coccineum]